MIYSIGRRAIHVVSEAAREMQNLAAIAFPTGTRHRLGSGHLTTNFLTQEKPDTPSPENVPGLGVPCAQAARGLVNTLQTHSLDLPATSMTVHGLLPRSL